MYHMRTLNLTIKQVIGFAVGWGLMLSGCGAQPAPEEAAAMSLPYTLLDTADIQIVIDRQDDALTFEAQCKGEASFQEIAVRISKSVANGDTSSSNYSATPATCTEADQVVISGTTMFFDTYGPEDQIEVAATLTHDDGAQSVSRTFTIGEDDQLYDADSADVP